MISAKQKQLYRLAIGFIIGFIIGFWGIGDMVLDNGMALPVLFILLVGVVIYQAIYIINLYNEDKGE